VDALKPEEKFGLIFLCPSFIWGKQISKEIHTSVGIIQSVLSGEYPSAPKIHFNGVSASDVAQAHILAMESEYQSGRYILNSDGMWMIDICKTLKKHFPNYPIPTSSLPDALTYVAALFDSRLTWKWLWFNLGWKANFDNTKFKKDFNFQFQPLEEALVETANSLIEGGFIKGHTK